MTNDELTQILASDLAKEIDAEIIKMIVDAHNNRQSVVLTEEHIKNHRLEETHKEIVIDILDI